MAASFCGKRVLLTRIHLLFNQKRNGYIVLVPEIGEDLPDKNPLLRGDGLLEFNNITIEKCVASIGKQAVDVEKNVRNLEESLSKTVQVKDVFRDIFNPLEHYSSPLETTWGLAKTLYLGNSSLMPTKSYLSIHDRARRARSAKFSNLQIYKAIENSTTTSTNEEERRLIHKFLLEGKLNGINLEGIKKLQLNEVLGKLGKERATFKGKVDTSIKQFSLKIDDYNLVRDFPPTLLQTTCVDSTQPTKGPWKITLQPNVYNSFLEYCGDKTMRWNIWQAETRKASGSTDKNLENSTHLEKIRALRNEQAKLLGYENFVQMSMETKMAESSENIINMFNSLNKQARPAQELELINLHTFAVKYGFQGNFEHCDIPYWRRKYIKSVFQYDEELLREYFPLPKVLSGLFNLSEKLFNIKIQERVGVNTWHEDVKFYDVFEDSDGKDPIAGFYVDLYSREDEKIRLQENPGWMVGIRNRSNITNTTPLAALIYNFQAPLYGKPSLLTFKDVQMLFSKFGYTLQHLLTKTNYSEVAGVSNIEWDAVQIPGHVLSSFLYEPNTLKEITSHYASEDSLPQSQLDAIVQHRSYFTGYDLCREMYIASLDLKLHIKKDYWLDIVKELWPIYNILPLDKKDAHPCSMTSLFSGDWGGAYFSNIWSRVVAADAYNAFSEAGKNSQTTEDVGKRFRETYLALGGSCAPAEVFRRFRGRDPSPKALLSSLGLNKQRTTADVEDK